MEEIINIAIPVALRCNQCGSEDIFVPEPEGCDDPVTCNACGADLGSRSAIDKRVRQDLDKQVPDQLDALLREAFEGSPNVRISKRDGEAGQ